MKSTIPTAEYDYFKKDFCKGLQKTGKCPFLKFI